MNVTVHDDYVYIDTSGASSKVTFRWEYDTAVGGDDGDGELELKDMAISAKFKVSVPVFMVQLEVEDVDVDIGDVDIDLHGTPISAVTKWLISILKGPLKDKVADVLQDLVVDAVSGVNSFLANVDPLAEIPDTSLDLYYDFLYFDYSDDEYITLSSIGQFWDTTHPTPKPPIPWYTPMPAFNATGADIQIFVNDYTINSLLYSMYTANYLAFNFTNEFVYDHTGVNITTKDIDLFIPQLAQFGDRAMGFDFAVADPVILELKEEGDFTMNTTVGLVVEGEGRVILFDAGFNVTFDIDLNDWVLGV